MQFNRALNCMNVSQIHKNNQNNKINRNNQINRAGIKLYEV